MFEFGIGCDKDWNVAVKLYEHSSNQGHPKGQFNLGILFYLFILLVIFSLIVYF